MRQKILLIVIIVLAAFLRFYSLDKTPPSLNWDEVSIGYNAYSILKTGRDEYGQAFPLFFRSFNDYKFPFYIYLTVPSVAVFGLNEFSVRFISAFLGTMAVFITYLFVKELLEKSPRASHIALLASFLLAISPWHLQFSRTGIYASLCFFCIVGGAYFFLKGLKSGKWLLISTIFFILGFYSYQPAVVFIPLLLLIFAVMFKRQLLAFKKQLIFSLVLGFCLLLPLIWATWRGETTRRFLGTGIFSEQTAILARSKVQMDDDLARSDALGIIIHNRRLIYGLYIIRNYLSHFEPNFLFITADAPRHHAPGVGLLYWIELPFLISGIYFWVKDKPRFWQIILWWLLVAPIAAAPTRETPHAIRSFLMVFPLLIFTAYGIIRTYESVRINIRKIFVFILSIFYLFNFIYYLHMYYVHMPIEYSQFWQYGYKDWVEYVMKNKDDYDKVIISQDLEQPQAFLLFYGKINPAEYLRAGGTKMIDPGSEKYKFDKFEFGKIPDDRRRGIVGNILYVGKPEEFATAQGRLVNIKALNGEEGVRISESY